MSIEFFSESHLSSTIGIRPPYRALKHR